MSRIRPETLSRRIPSIFPWPRDIISYKVSCIFQKANYMQVTPSYNGTAHLETGIYFATTTDGSSACGSAFLILEAPSPTTFTLNYSGSADARDGEINLTIVKLRRTL